MGIAEAIKNRIKGEIQHRQNVRSAYTEARHAEDIRIQKRVAERDARARYLPPKGQSRGERMLAVFGSGGGSSDFDKRLRSVTGEGKSYGGMAGLTSFEKKHSGSGGLGAFEKRANAALMGKPYSEPRKHKHKQPNVVIVGGKRYYRAG